MDDFPDPWTTHEFVTHINESAIGGEESLKTENLAPYQEVRGASFASLAVVYFIFLKPRSPPAGCI